jgi:hypothetical protein
MRMRNVILNFQEARFGHRTSVLDGFALGSSLSMRSCSGAPLSLWSFDFGTMAVLFSFLVIEIALYACCLGSLEKLGVVLFMPFGNPLSAVLLPGQMWWSPFRSGKSNWGITIYIRFRRFWVH